MTKLSGSEKPFWTAGGGAFDVGFPWAYSSARKRAASCLSTGRFDHRPRPFAAFMRSLTNSGRSLSKYRRRYSSGDDSARARLSARRSALTLAALTALSWLKLPGVDAPRAIVFFVRL